MGNALRLPVRSRGEKRGNRRERHRAETRERLYRAALELFAERGFLETTVEDITESADVGKGTFFNYFPTKEHILAEFGGERTAAVERALELLAFEILRLQSGDISANDLARMMQTTFMGVTMSWAINPELSLRKNANELWELLRPSLRRAESETVRRSGSARNAGWQAGSPRIKLRN